MNDPSTGQRPGTKLIIATVVGNMLEFYDFLIYGTMTAVVLNQVFFPASDPTVGTLLAFGAFAVGFISRPFGAMVFGHFGDRLGRKPVLALTLGIVGASTFLMGLLPTYAAIGVWAPLALTALRFIQGFALGGEWGGAVSLMVESSPEKRRGFYGSLIQLGAGLGIVLGSLTVTILLTVLTTEQLLAWGWRIPFLLSIVLVGVGMAVRMQLSESPAFQRIRNTGATKRVSMFATLRKSPRNIVVTTGLYVANSAFGFMLGVFGISYTVNQLGLPRSVAVTANLVGGIAYLLMAPVGGWISDRFDRRRAYAFFATLMIPAAFSFFWLLDTKSIALVFIANIIGSGVAGGLFGIQAAFFSELFPTGNRYSGISLGFPLGSVLGGALMPTVATLLLQASGGHPWSIAVYMSALTIITLVATAAARIVGFTKQDAAARPIVTGDHV
ncbi:MFS transporter [Amycolatopsis jejuensis]|uniref:MFS transporter n=1 Tax=Amycolatopsis jejuensis TaxID=330084 RepID=UPI00068FB5F6|nr:MFS transporter [Amycolatopsis jejuensis]